MLSGEAHARPRGRSRGYLIGATVLISLLGLAAISVGGLIGILGEPDPDGPYGADARSPERALYYTRKHIRAELNSQGATNVAFCDATNTDIERPGAFVYLVRSCVEFDRGGRHQKLRFFAQAERSPIDGPSYTLAQLRLEDAMEEAAEDGPPTEPVIAPRPPQQIVVGRYRAVASQHSLGEGAFELYLDGSRIMRLEGGSFSLADLDGAPASWKNGNDITGDGTPDLVVQEYSGGAHCCSTWRIVSLFSPPTSSPPTVLLELDNGHSPNFPFRDFDGDGVFEVQRDDWTFAYWNAPFSDSPPISLTYRLQDGKLAFAPDLMRKPPLSAEELRSRSAALNWEESAVENDFHVPPQLWAELITLIQTGNHRQVEQFTRLAWRPSAVVTPELFLAAFYQQLRESPNNSDIQSLLATEAAGRQIAWQDWWSYAR